MKATVRSVALVLALVLVACAGEVVDSGSDRTTTTSSTTSTAWHDLVVDLHITIGTDDLPAEFTADLSCGEESAGEGYLAERAQSACDFLASSAAARTLLVEGPDDDRACTEIFGGGEVADISGTLGDAVVSISVDRANGCGIADWDLLQPILVEPYDLARQAACSGGGARLGDDSAQGDLPAVVSEVRARLLAGARMCDFDGLGALAVAEGTNISFGGDDDPAAFWRDLETNGGRPIGDMIAILHLAPGMVEFEDGTVYYVWPAVAALEDWSQATDEQREELADIFGADALADWDLFGGYIGYRVGISDDGSWRFFVAGD